MAVRSDRHGAPSADGTPSHVSPDGLDAVLARVPVSADRWAEALPPVPADTVVTVSFSSPSVLAEHAEALELLGYRVLDAPSLPSGAQAAWVLVRREAVEGRRAWWDTVRGLSDRVYDLRFGPALRLLGPILGAHLAVAQRTR